VKKTETAETAKKRTITRRQIGALLITIAIIIDSVGWFSAPFFIQDAKITVTQRGVVDYWHTIGFPPVDIVSLIILTVKGSLSVNNQVHVHVVILDANITHLSNYYNRIGFTDAINANSLQSELPTYSSIPLLPNATDNLVADGDVKWLHEGPSWMYFMPNYVTGILVVRYPDVEKGMYTANITPLGDTLTIQNAIVTIRLTFVLIGFSFLTAQPVIEAICKIKKSCDQEQKPPKPQGLWHQYRRIRKS
jgi:hypothetical protein